jgi:hypothetical protein
MGNFEFNYWAMLEPMKYYDKIDDTALSANLLAKKYAMIENQNNEYIASQKWDGEWTMFIKDGDNILIRSRSLSKVTGVYGDKTAHLPHLVEEMKYWPDGTVVLGEVCWGELGTVSTDVGTILRCLPAKAIERQKDRKLIVKVFDILCFDGVNYMDRGYAMRVESLKLFFSTAWCHYFTPTTFFTDDFQEAADDIIRAGGEGVVIQRKDYGYEPGKRSAWKTLQLKQRLEDMTLQVVATKAPTKEYQGKEVATWEYWEGTDKYSGETYRHNGPKPKDNGIIWKPVSKAYYFGWKMGITCNFNGVLIDASSGLTDEDREWLASEEATQAIEHGQLYAEIRSMMVASLGGLRHPVIHKLRVLDDAMHDGIEDVPLRGREV